MDKQKKGIWHRYDQNRVNNGYASNYYDEEFTDKGGMDYLTVGDGTTMTHFTDHVRVPNGQQTIGSDDFPQDGKSFLHIQDVLPLGKEPKAEEHQCQYD